VKPSRFREVEMKSKAEIVKETRAKRKAEGLCVGCGKTPPLEGRTLCAPCAEYQGRANKKAKERRLAGSICAVCYKEPALPHRQKCAGCTERLNQSAKTERKQLQANGTCPYCKVNPVRTTKRGLPGKRCNGCYEKHNTKAMVLYKKLVAEKRCVLCCTADAFPGRIYCKPCQGRLLVLKYGKYGFTEGHIELHGKECNICKEPFDFPATVFHVDHQHENEADPVGKYRGLLCGSCNNGIARFKDSPGLLRAAALYLEERGTPYKSAVDWTGFTDQFYRGSKWTKTEPPLSN
jgi:hypothetical protein